MKGARKMLGITALLIALGVGFGLVAASLALALTGCGKAGGETTPLQANIKVTIKPVGAIHNVCEANLRLAKQSPASRAPSTPV